MLIKTRTKIIELLRNSNSNNPILFETMNSLMIQILENYDLSYEGKTCDIRRKAAVDYITAIKVFKAELQKLDSNITFSNYCHALDIDYIRKQVYNI